MQFKLDHDDAKITLTNISTGQSYVLPGISQGIFIDGNIIWEKIANKQQTYKEYQAKTITLNLILVDNTFSNLITEIPLDNQTIVYPARTALDQLVQLEQLFQEKDDSTQKIPIEYQINNNHINKRGIETVFFQSLSSSESNNKSEISVNINFEEIKFPSYSVIES